MSASYCMKNCDECAGNCGGCRSGAYVGQCEIAKCCREKGHVSCEDCLNRPGCRTCMASSQMPGKLIAEQRRAEEQQQLKISRAGIMALWVKVIFWCWAAEFISGFLDLDFIAHGHPIANLIDVVVSVVAMTVTGFSYLKMKELDDRFVFVGYVQLASIVYSALSASLPERNILVIVLTFVFAVVNVMSLYRMCMAYSDVLADFGTIYSQKWQSQLTLYLYGFCGVLGGGVMLIIPFLRIIGVIAMLVALILVIFTTIRQGVYLYQTANFCADYHRWGN